MTTAEDWLDLTPGIGVRADHFEFEIINQGRFHLGTLDVSIEPTPSVQVDTNRTSMRMLNNLEILATDLSDINILRDRVRVWMITPDGTRWPLGVFMFGEQSLVPHSWGNRYRPQLFDEGFLLNQRMPITHNVERNGSVLTLFKDMIAEIGMSTVGINVPDKSASSPLVYPVGTLRYDALKALAQILECFPPYFSNTGRLTLTQVPPRGSQNVDHVYDVGSRIIDGSVSIVNDAYTAPNRWIVLGSTTTGSPVVGIYDLPSTSPASALVTGRIVTADVVHVQGIIDARQADIVARNIAVTDRTVFDKATFTSTADPRHDVFDTVLLLNTRYLETGWTIDCESGGLMSHNLSKIYD